MLPTVVALDREERHLLDHAHYAYIAGTGFAATSPTWIIIYYLSSYTPAENASLSSVRWLCLEESAQIIFVAVAHVRFWRLFRGFRHDRSSPDRTAKTLSNLARAFKVLPAWLVARLTLLPLLADPILYGCHDINHRTAECERHETLQSLKDPWYYLSYMSMSQWAVVKWFGAKSFGTSEMLPWILMVYVAALAMGAVTALPALCSWKGIAHRMGFGFAKLRSREAEGGKTKD